MRLKSICWKFSMFFCLAWFGVNEVFMIFGRCIALSIYIIYIWKWRFFIATIFDFSRLFSPFFYQNYQKFDDIFIMRRDVVDEFIKKIFQVGRLCNLGPKKDSWNSIFIFHFRSITQGISVQFTFTPKITK